MSDYYIKLPPRAIPTYASAAVFPPSAPDGSQAIALDTDTIYIFNVGTGTWIAVATPGAAIALDGLTGDVTATGPGVAPATVAAIQGTLVSGTTGTGSVVFSNSPTLTGTISGVTANLSGTITASNLSGTNTGNVTLTTVGNAPNADGASLSGQILTLQPADANHPGVLTANDWNIFNNKLSGTRGNYINNPDAEIDTSGWNLYSNIGRTDPAFVVVYDITYTAVASGDAGNGINIDYIFHPTQPYTTPLVTVVSPTHITVAWYNGPTVSNNPSATQLKAAFDAVPGAVALATATITGTASRLQYITGSHFLAGGGDTSPTTGTGGTATGVTFTRSLIDPIVGIASFDLGKDGVSREGEGVSTDFSINALDEGVPLQISFAYSASSGMNLGTNSDVQVFVYDIINAALIVVTPLRTLAGPVSTIKTFVGQFVTAANSVDYRLILHIASANTAAWDLSLDNFVVSSVLNPSEPTEVPSVVLPDQAISAAVTDHMAVAWTDGANKWVPATSSYNGDYWSMLGFATNIVGLTADIYVHGELDGFSFGPFAGYDQYVDPANPGQLTPLPAPFTDTYVIMGRAISATAINIQVFKGLDLVPTKGGLLTNAGANNGTGDQVLAVGTNGSVLVANSAAALGINWAAAIVNGGGFTYTTASRTLVGTLSGDVTGPLTATAISAATVTGKAITGFVSGAGTVTAADTILTAINKLNGNVAGKQATGNYITALTGDGTAAGPGSVALTLATVATPGTSTKVTYNAKGLITSGTTLASGDIPNNAANTSGSSGSFTGSLVGDVTGTQGATVISAATVTGKLITGYVSGAGTVAATDTILQAIDKLNGNTLLKAPLASPVFTGDVNVSTGNLLISTIGKGLQIKTGANAKIGTIALVGGAATVADTSITANSRIFVTSNTDGGTPGWLRVSAKTVGTSFVITSSSATDTSTVAWTIVESIP